MQIPLFSTTQLLKLNALPLSYWYVTSHAGIKPSHVTTERITKQDMADMPTVKADNGAPVATSPPFPMTSFTPPPCYSIWIH